MRSSTNHWEIALLARVLTFYFLIFLNLLVNEREKNDNLKIVYLQWNIGNVDKSGSH